MSRFILALVFGVTCLHGQAGWALTLTLTGPASFTGTVAGHSDWGIQFDALVSVQLIAFDYHHQGMSGTVEVVNVTDSSTIFTRSWTIDLSRSAL